MLSEMTHALQRLRADLQKRLERDPVLGLVSVQANLCEDARTIMLFVDLDDGDTLAICFVLPLGRRFDTELRGLIEAAAEDECNAVLMASDAASAVLH